MKISELMEDAKTYKFAIVEEGHWEDEDDEGEFSMMPVYVVSAAELKQFMKENDVEFVSDLTEELYGDADAQGKLADALSSDKLGTKKGECRVGNPDPDLGMEGVETTAKDVNLLFPPL